MQIISNKTQFDQLNLVINELTVVTGGQRSQWIPIPVRLGERFRPLFSAAVPWVWTSGMSPSVTPPMTSAPASASHSSEDKHTVVYGFTSNQSAFNKETFTQTEPSPEQLPSPPSPP